MVPRQRVDARTMATRSAEGKRRLGKCLHRVEAQRRALTYPTGQHVCVPLYHVASLHLEARRWISSIGAVDRHAILPQLLNAVSSAPTEELWRAGECCPASAVVVPRPMHAASLLYGRCWLRCVCTRSHSASSLSPQIVKSSPPIFWKGTLRHAGVARRCFACCAKHSKCLSIAFVPCTISCICLLVSSISLRVFSIARWV